MAVGSRRCPARALQQSPGHSTCRVACVDRITDDRARDCQRVAERADHPVDPLDRNIEHLDFGVGCDQDGVVDQLFAKLGEVGAQFPEVAFQRADAGRIRRALSMLAFLSARLEIGDDRVDPLLGGRRLARHPACDLDRGAKGDAGFLIGFPCHFTRCRKAAAPQGYRRAGFGEVAAFDEGARWGHVPDAHTSGISPGIDGCRDEQMGPWLAPAFVETDNCGGSAGHLHRYGGKR